jgi:uncharacterized membrane protein YebE (DUF533 family)
MDVILASIRNAHDTHRCYLHVIAHRAHHSTMETIMLDINRLLTQVMDGQVMGGQPSGGERSNFDRTNFQAHDHGTVTRHEHQASPPLARSLSESGVLRHVGSLGTGALAGGLAGILMGSKRMREVAGTAVQIGAVAAIGGLAYKAYQNYRQGKPIVPQSITDMISGVQGLSQNADKQTPAALQEWIPQRERSEEVAKLLLRTMVAAAAADGHLDGTEYGRIRQQLLADGLSEEEQFFLSQLIMRPPSIPELAASATTPELKAEVYAAARLAIEPDSPVEREWLEQLAAVLNLQAGLKAHLDAIGGDAHAQAA